MIIALVVIAAVSATTLEATPYGAAREQADKFGIPILVMVCRESCGPCQSMKRTVLPKLAKEGAFDTILFVPLDCEQEPELCAEVGTTNPTPVIVLWRKTPKGWKHKQLVGGQTVEDMRDFLRIEDEK
jgi:hypothetical protein